MAAAGGIDGHRSVDGIAAIAHDAVKEGCKAVLFDAKRQSVDPAEDQVGFGIAPAGGAGDSLDDGDGRARGLLTEVEANMEAAGGAALGKLCGGMVALRSGGVEAVEIEVGLPALAEVAEIFALEITNNLTTPAGTAPRTSRRPDKAMSAPLESTLISTRQPCR